MRYTDESSNPGCPIMIWNPTTDQPINELDSGMMPPPSTLPLSVRRPSSAGQYSADQISPPMLKSELIDENSQSSLPDTMNHDSMDRLQTPGSNENSMDGVSPLKDNCAVLQYAVQQQQQQQHRIRKQSIDLMDSNSLMVGGGGGPTGTNAVDIMMHDSNSMSTFPSHDTRMDMMQLDSSSPKLKVVDLRVKQEQIAAQLQQYVNNTKAAADAQQQLLQIAPANASFCNKFLTNLDSANVSGMNGGGAGPCDSVAVALFSQNSNNNSSSNNDVIFTTQTMNNLNVSTNTSNIDPRYSQHNLMTDANVAAAASAMSPHILSYSPTTSPGTNASLMDAIHSPLSQDVILNSPVSHLGGNNSSANMSMLASPTTNVPQNAMNMSSDIILNPTVSPTMMCHTNDQSNLIQTQVTSVLTCHPMAAAGQNVQTSPTIMGGMMQPIISPPQQQQQQDQPIHIPRTSPVAVKNMILNAAADILSSQPSAISAESTINALISLNSETMMVDQPSAVPPMMITQASVGGMASNRLVVNQICGQQTGQQQQQQASIEQQMPALFGGATMMGTEMVPVTTSSMLGSMSELLNQELRNDQLRRAQQEFINDMK